MTQTAISDLTPASAKIPTSPTTPPDSPKDSAKRENEPSETKNDGSVILSERARKIFDSIKAHPANFTDAYLISLDLTKFEVVIEDDAFDFLNQTYIINNEESIADVLLGILETGHKHRPRKTTPSSQSSTSATTSSSSQPSWRITVGRRPDGVAIPERPQKQKKSLAEQNCGIERKKFGSFLAKHVIDPKMTDANHFSGLAYLTTIWNRIHEAYVNFSWFFITDVDQVTYTYQEKDDKCIADQQFPMVTCQRHHQSDHIAVCYFSGQCSPSYYSSTGHFVRPQCKPEPLPEEEHNAAEEQAVIPDYFVTLEKIRELQDLFAARILAAPPMKLDWALSEWRARWWIAHRENREFDLDLYPEPTGTPTQREILLAQYIDAVNKLDIESIPESVLRLFYFQPRLFLESMPNGHRQGLIFIRNSMMTVNRDFAGEPSTQDIPPPPGPPPTMNDDNFPALGSRHTPVVEHHTNPLRETYQETSERIAEIIRSIFVRQPQQQIQPTAEDVEALYRLH